MHTYTVKYVKMYTHTHTYTLKDWAKSFQTSQQQQQQKCETKIFNIHIQTHTHICMCEGQLRFVWFLLALQKKQQQKMLILSSVFYHKKLFIPSTQILIKSRTTKSCFTGTCETASRTRAAGLSVCRAGQNLNSDLLLQYTGVFLNVEISTHT